MKKITEILLIILFISFNSVFSQITVEEAFPNLLFEKPLDLQHSPDESNRLFVVEQEGFIYVFENETQVTNKVLFMDISDRLVFGGERGLLGLTFHPEYENNGYFYVNYTATNPLRTIVSRFHVSSNDSNQADDASEIIIIEITQPFNNHNGGQIAFGADGYLYIGMGDGGAGGDPYGHGQNLHTLHGSMLRIDVDNPADGQNYGIPNDNPFVNTEYREEIFAYGFRNPWRFSFDTASDICWIADVGQDLYEEIDILESGGNFGWNIMEGEQCFNPPFGCDTTGLIMPIFEYDHSWGESITGGFVYRGDMIPDIHGKYIFADFEYGDIWSLEYEIGTQPEVESLGDLGPYSVTSFGVDKNNELFICSFDGKIYKLVQSTVTIAVDYSFNWNLVGLPVMMEESYYQLIFPGSIEGTLYYFDEGYMNGSNLINGEGYWLRFPDDGYSIITGIALNELAIQLTEGWNLISAVTDVVNISDIQDQNELIIPGTIFSFNSGGYSNTQNLEPGNGYWLRAISSGTITITNF